jgi:hypothetical protein
MDDAWIDAARHYSSLSETARLEYWNRLTPEQRDLLTTALSAQEPARARATRSGRSFLGTMAIGCTGMILGSVLTVVVQVMLIREGMSALLGGSGNTSALSRSAPAAPQPLRDEDLTNIDCSTLLKTNPDLYSQCMSRQKAEEEMVRRTERTNRGEDSD